MGYPILYEYELLTNVFQKRMFPADGLKAQGQEKNETVMRREGDSVKKRLCTLSPHHRVTLSL